MELVRKRKRYITIITAILLVGLITVSLAYKERITAKITGRAVQEGQTISESEAARILVEYVNNNYGEARFSRSQDLGSIYLVVVEHDKEQYNFFITKDGKYFSNNMELIRINNTQDD